MQKFILPIICTSVLLLSACGKTTPAEPINTPTETTPVLSSGATASSGSATQLSKDTQAIINVQLKSPEAILSLDCTTYDAEGKAYCATEKTKMEAQKNEVTWQKVLAKGNEYIKTFDCSTIVSTFGQKYCTEHQAKIPKGTPATSSGANTATASGANMLK
jgi:hypothetical protein